MSVKSSYEARMLGVQKQALRIPAVFCLLALLSGAALNVQAYEVLLHPDTSFVAPFDTFEVNIEVDADVTGIHCFVVTVTFDSSLIELLDVLEGPLLPAQGPTFPFWNDNGTEYDIGNCLLGYGLYADGPGVLATLQFRTGGSAGVTALTFTLVNFQDVDLDSMDMGYSHGAVVVMGNQIPTVEVTSPSSGGTYSSPPTLPVEFNDDMGLDRGYYQIDGCEGTWTELWSYNSDASDTTIGWAVPSVSEGSHSIYFKVTDDTGNVNEDTCSYSWTFTYLEGCCIGITGNVDNDPTGMVDLGDLTSLIDYLFISFTAPVCIEEANVDGDQSGMVDLGDLTALIDYLFISFTPPAECP